METNKREIFIELKSKFDWAENDFKQRGPRASKRNDVKFNKEFDTLTPAEQTRAIIDMQEEWKKISPFPEDNEV